MRIGVDGYNLAMPQATGVATYGYELAAAYAAMGHQVEGIFGLPVPGPEALREVAFFDRFQRAADQVHHRPGGKWAKRAEWLRAFAPQRGLEVPRTTAVEKAEFIGRLPAFSRLVTAPNLFERAERRFRRTGRFTVLRVENPPELMHWTYPLPVMLENSRNIYTLHDLVPLKLPYTTLDDKQLYGSLIAECVRRADHLCTVSQSSARDIIERYGIDEARITNTYQASTQRAAGDPAAAARAVEGIFGLTAQGYFLYVGAIEPKKNVRRLIEAYLSLASTTPLVIVGGRSWQSEEQLRLMPGGGASGAAGSYAGHRGQSIIRLDYLPNGLLGQLMAGARAMLFPSLYEGFGLPVLEAMQLGTPVITANTASLPEVAGDAGLLVDPYDVGSLAAAMRQVDNDVELRARLSHRGRGRAEAFSSARYHERLQLMHQRMGLGR